MMPENENTARSGAFQFLKLGPTFLPFMIKSLFAYYKLKRNAKKASRIFEKELVAQGIDEEHAKEMAEIYRDSSKVIGKIFSNTQKK